jgi:hypothetical protein
VLQRRGRDAAETDESPEQGANHRQLNRLFTFRFQFLDCVHWQAGQSREQWTLIHKLCGMQCALEIEPKSQATPVGLLPNPHHTSLPVRNRNWSRCSARNLVAFKVNFVGEFQFVQYLINNKALP